MPIVFKGLHIGQDDDVLEALNHFQHQLQNRLMPFSDQHPFATQTGPLGLLAKEPLAWIPHLCIFTSSLLQALVHFNLR